MKKNLNTHQLPDNQRTRDAIMAKSLEIINTNGMIDFRIDSLSSSLLLSPGNITYHFSRKEDICSALWDAYLYEFSVVKNSLTTLLDIKQLYLMNRVSLLLAYKYRGVLIFRSADFGAICRDEKTNRDNIEFHHCTSLEMFRLLSHSGYMVENASQLETCEMAIENNYLILRWAINLLFQEYAVNEVEKHIDQAALLSLHAIYPLLTEKGQKEFMEISNIVSEGKLI